MRTIHELAAQFIHIYTKGRKDPVPAVEPNELFKSTYLPPGPKEVDAELAAYLKFLEEENINDKP
jgi:hypothetical protein